MRLVLVVLAILTSTRVGAGELTRRAVVWTGPGSARDQRDVSRRDMSRFVTEFGAVPVADVFDAPEIGSGPDSGSLEGFRTLVAKSLKGTAPTVSPLELTIVLVAHGSVDEDERLHIETHSSAGPTAVPLARFLDVVAEEFDARFGSEQDRVRLNLIVSSCYSGHAGLTPIGHAIARRGIALTVLGFTGLGQSSFRINDGFTLAAAGIIDRHARAWGVDLCVGCTWIERITRLLGAFPVWVAAGSKTTGGPVVYGGPAVTRPFSDLEFLQATAELMHYRFGPEALLAAADLIARRTPPERARFGRRVRTLAPTLPVIEIFWPLVERRYERALHALLEFTGRADLSDWGDRERFARLITLILDRAFREHRRIDSDLGTQLRDRKITLLNPNLCGVALSTAHRVRRRP